MSVTYSLADVLDGFVERRLRNVNTAIPGRVESYDATTQKANVQPLIKQAYTDESGYRVAEDLPVIPGVPVVFPGSGAYTITFPVAKGDTVLLIFSQASLDKWRKSGGKVDPGDDSHHDLSDAIAIPGLRPFNAATKDVAPAAMVLGASEIRLGSKDALDPVVLKSELAALRTLFNSHTHITTATIGTGGPGIVKPTDALWPAIVGSTKVKAE